MAVAKKKADVCEVPPQPKPFEVGYKFLVEAKIIDNVYDGDDCYGEQWPYLVEVVLDDGACNIESVGLSFSKEELVAFISKTNPKFKKDYITQQLKDAKALVVSLEKQLAAN